MTEPSRPGIDVTDSVMKRLGFERALDPAAARRLRMRRLAVRGLQATAATLAVAAVALWWWRGDGVTAHAPVGDAFRGSVVQGAGRLDAELLGLPKASRRPETDTAGAPATADAESPRTY
jgi:hypothetical protein